MNKMLNMIKKQSEFIQIVSHLFNLVNSKKGLKGGEKMQSWRGVLKGRMYEHGITNIMIREKIGVSREYVAKMFTGKRCPTTAETRLTAAVDRIIAERGVFNVIR